MNVTLGDLHCSRLKCTVYIPLVIICAEVIIILHENDLKK